jgi:predicted GNAT superfamily acetyltransferase
VLEEVDTLPVPRTVPADADLVAVATPPDVESLRRSDPPLATRWRFAVREALEPLMAEGTVAGFTRAGSYLVRRRTSPA